MTREEQRNKAAKEHAAQWYQELGTSVEEFSTDAQITIDEFIKGAEWADNHPDWHKVDEELPPPSIKVLVTDGNSIEYGWYDYYRNEWRGLMAKVTHWMYLPELPKED